MGKQIVTGKFRGAFMSPLTKRSFGDGGKPKFEITMLFDKKKGKRDVEAIRKLCLAAIKENKPGWTDKRLDAVKKTFEKTLFVDGDEKEYDGFEGCIAIKAKNSRRVIVVDPNVDEITDPEDVPSGYYYKANISAFLYKAPKGKPGVGISLHHVQLVEKGEVFGSGAADPADVFDKAEGFDDDDDLEDGDLDDDFDDDEDEDDDDPF